MYFAVNFLRLLKKKKKGTVFPENAVFKRMGILIIVHLHFSWRNSTKKNAQFQTTGDKQHNTRALRSLNGDEKNVNVLKSP